MPLWRYRAIAMNGPARGIAQRGEMAGESAAEVRAALRRIGLQVLDIRARRSPDRDSGARWLAVLGDRIHAHLRTRRRMQVSELYDALATMLESGMPLLESLETASRAARAKRLRSMLILLRDQLRCGASLADAMAMRPCQGWFDPIAAAMVRAAQHAGDLPDALRRLADREQRSESVNQKLLSALLYPAIVLCVGIGVVIFLSVKTLPDLVAILQDADIEAPMLTRAIIALGGFISAWWWGLMLLVAVSPIAMIALGRLVASGGRGQRIVREVRDRMTLRVFRRLALAHAAQRLAELARSGVPIVDALNIIAPTTPGALRLHLEAAAAAVERGDDLAIALADERWFDAEFKQLLAIGQASGELHDLLETIAERYTRQAERLIDRLAALLEPAVILALAFLIGIVVMAAIQPLVRLQEVLS